MKPFCRVGIKPGASEVSQKPELGRSYAAQDEDAGRRAFTKRDTTSGEFLAQKKDD
jgi:hypothetical protein